MSSTSYNHHNNEDHLKDKDKGILGQEETAFRSKPPLTTYDMKDSMNKSYKSEDLMDQGYNNHDFMNKGKSSFGQESTLHSDPLSSTSNNNDLMDKGNSSFGLESTMLLDPLSSSNNNNDGWMDKGSSSLGQTDPLLSSSINKNDGWMDKGSSSLGQTDPLLSSSINNNDGWMDKGSSSLGQTDPLLSSSINKNDGWMDKGSSSFNKDNYDLMYKGYNDRDLIDNKHHSEIGQESTPLHPNQLLTESREEKAWMNVGDVEDPATTRERVGDKVDHVKEKAEKVKDNVKDKAEEVKHTAKEKVQEVKEKVQENAEDVHGAAKEKVEDFRTYGQKLGQKIDELQAKYPQAFAEGETVFKDIVDKALYNLATYRTLEPSAAQKLAHKIKYAFKEEPTVGEKLGETVDAAADFYATTGSLNPTLGNKMRYAGHKVKSAFGTEPTVGEKVEEKIDHAGEKVNNLATYGTTEPSTGQVIGQKVKTTFGQPSFGDKIGNTVGDIAKDRASDLGDVAKDKVDTLVASHVNNGPTMGEKFGHKFDKMKTEFDQQPITGENVTKKIDEAADKASELIDTAKEQVDDIATHGITNSSTGQKIGEKAKSAIGQENLDKAANLANNLANKHGHGTDASSSGQKIGHEVEIDKENARNNSGTTTQPLTGQKLAGQGITERGGATYSMY